MIIDKLKTEWQTDRLKSKEINQKKKVQTNKPATSKDAVSSAAASVTKRGGSRSHRAPPTPNYFEAAAIIHIQKRQLKTGKL